MSTSDDEIEPLGFLLHFTYLDYNDYSSLWLSGLTIDVLQWQSRPGSSHHPILVEYT